MITFIHRTNVRTTPVSKTEYKERYANLNEYNEGFQGWFAREEELEAFHRSYKPVRKAVRNGY